MNVSHERRETETLRTDLTSWEIGPYHGSLPGPMRLRLVLDGEVIVSAVADSGFLHRGLEKAIERHPWEAAVTYADHLDPEAAVFGELALCLAVEEIAGVEVPPRAVSIRAILSELSRVSSHMLHVVHVARAVGEETLIHYVLRDRERILDLFELLTGARFSLNFLRYGGVRADVTEGFIERILEICEMIRVRIKEYNDLFTFNHTFLKRTSGVGELTAGLIRRTGITGPNARAAGIAFDVRRAHPYLNYSVQDFAIPLGRSDRKSSGDAHDRFLVRLRELSESLGILKHIGEGMPTGEYLNPKILTENPKSGSPEVKVPAGEAYSRVESPRGLLGCHVISDGARRPARVQFRTPSSACVMAMPELLAGIRIEDLPVMLASLDISVAEADR